MSELAGIPAMRFPEFSGLWEEHRVTDLTKYYDGTHQTPNYVSEGVAFFSVEHVTSNNFIDTKLVSREVFERENQRVKVERGDILMTRIGDVGTARYIDWDVEASFYVSLALIKQADNFSSKFLAQAIGSERFQRELWKRTIHVAFPRKINLGEIGNCPTNLPSLPEQQKIADFLGAVDARVGLLRRRRDALRAYKKGMMQHLFSQDLRFIKPDGSPFPDWQEKRLGEICKIDWGNTNLTKSSYSATGKYLAVSASGCDGRIAHSEHQAMTPVLSAIGALCGKMFLPTEPFTAIKNTIVLKSFSSNTYLYQFLLVFKFPIQGAGQPFIGKRDLEQSKISIPHPEEQQKIADTLTALDAKIDAVTAQMDAMGRFKKGLLQQMFV